MRRCRPSAALATEPHRHRGLGLRQAGSTTHGQWRGLTLFYAALLSVTASGADATAAKAPLRDERWSFEDVALKPSPQVTWGRLDNGLRYAIKRHLSPPGRLSLRLVVNVGSLDEDNHERGYAHFVEHLAFVGTTNFPSGELVKFLQRQGAVFGPHINASTTTTSTVYKLELPDNSPDTLVNGLRILGDYADGLLFDPAEVRREKGVIQGENQFLQTDDEAERRARMRLLYDGTLIPDRQPIGLMPVIEKADPDSLKDFYQAWYRPANMGVVLVGDIDPARAETLIRAQFASIKARSPARPRPYVGNVAPPWRPRVATFATEAKNVEISVIKVAPGVPAPPTWGTRLNHVRVQSAVAMLARRLHRLSHAPNPPISTSTVTSDVEFGRFRVLEAKVTTSPEGWENALSLVEQQLRGALTHGFGEDELTVQKNSLRTAFQNSARTTGTYPSAKIAEMLAGAMEGYGPFTFPGENLATDLAMVDRLTAAECRNALEEQWGGSAPYIFITGAAPLPEVKKVRAVYAASRRVPAGSPPAVAAAVFAYEDFGPAGLIAEKTYVADLDLWLVRLANGVRLNLKRTPFETGLARLKLRIGNGEFVEPSDQPGLRFWTGAWWDGGLRKHTVAEMNVIGDGLEGITTGADEGALTLTSSTRTENLPRALRQLTAMVTDPAFRPDGHQVTTAKLHALLDPLWRSPEGARQRFVFPALADPALRKQFPGPEVIFTRTLEEFRAWVTPQLASGGIEVAMAGDFDVDNLIAEFARTLGTLPPRPTPPPPTAGVVAPLPPATTATLFYDGAAERPTTLDIYWPVRGALTTQTRRQLEMLALVLDDRVRDEVRDKKGAAYTSHALFFDSASYPGLAAIRCSLEVKPRDAGFYCDAVRDLAASIAAQGVTPDELTRAKAQTFAALQQARTDNLYWLNTVLSEAQRRPERLAHQRSVETDVARTTVEDLNALAHRYLGADQAFRYIIEPSARKSKQN